MLRDLLAIVDSGKFEDLGRIDIVGAEWSAGDLVLRFNIDPGNGVTENWTVTCSSVLEYLLSREENCGLAHCTGEHPVTAQFTEPHERLYFKGPSRSPDALLGKLWLAHRRATDDWIPFDRYLNTQLTTGELLVSSSGCLAIGPSFLIEAYASLLDEEAMQPHRLEAEPEVYVAQAELLHFGSSYVVSAGFNAARSAA